MYFNKKIAAIAAGIIIPLSGGIAVTAMASTAQPGTNTFNYCVERGPGAGATGNVVLNNWDNSPCPSGTYNHTLRVVDSDPFIPPNFTLDSSSINPTRSESGLAFFITDFATVPATVWDCMYTAPVKDGGAPGVVCTKH